MVVEAPFFANMPPPLMMPLNVVVAAALADESVNVAAEPSDAVFATVSVLEVPFDIEPPALEKRILPVPSESLVRMVMLPPADIDVLTGIKVASLQPKRACTVHINTAGAGDDTGNVNKV